MVFSMLTRNAFAALASAVGAIALAPTTASATYPGADGRIAFSQADSAREPSGDLYLVEPDGTDLVQLTDLPDHESQPSWSADGQRIVFTVYVLGGGGTWIYTMGADGSEQRPVVHVDIGDVGDAQAISPTFTPSGSEIVYSTRSAIRSIGVDGTDPETIYRVPGTRSGRCCVSDPTVSPDGKLIAFVRTAPRLRNSGLWTMNRNGEKLRRLSSAPRDRGMKNPDFSPDGKDLYVQRGFGHRTIPLDGSRESKIPGLSDAFQVSLSPSGDNVVGQAGVYSTDGLSSCGYLFTQPLTGSYRFQLTANCQTPSDATAAWPSWQPVPAP
jgi:Tol biopolymer transport system component